MKKMNNLIINNNKLIAEFMGWKEMSHTKSKNWMLSETIEGITYAKKECSLEQLQFNTSWDWLMPVVEKIEEFGFSSHIKYVPESLINLVSIIDYNSTPINMIVNTGFETKIEALYMAIIEFITWHTTQSK